jgi:hypothetical protein
MSHSKSVLYKWDGGFIKILGTGQFGLSFNITRHIFFVLAKKKFCRFYEFWKNFGLAQKNGYKWLDGYSYIEYSDFLIFIAF